MADATLALPAPTVSSNASSQRLRLKSSSPARRRRYHRKCAPTLRLLRLLSAPPAAAVAASPAQHPAVRPMADPAPGCTETQARSAPDSGYSPPRCTAPRVPPESQPPPHRPARCESNTCADAPPPPTDRAPPDGPPEPQSTRTPLRCVKPQCPASTAHPQGIRFSINYQQQYIRNIYE